MKTIDKKSYSELEFDLRWQSHMGQHRERYLAQNVNFWRDIFPEELSQALMGKKVGDRIEHTFSAGSVTAPFEAGQILDLYKTQFRPRLVNGHTIEPRYGRYYPKGLLKGVAGIYSNSVEPFRCLGSESSRFKIDFNHPLAKKALHVTVTVLDVREKNGDRGGRLNAWMEEVTNGPGMQTRANGKPTDFFSDDAFSRNADQKDVVFYEKPRFVSHIDDQAQSHIRGLYGYLLKPETAVLDLMSSWQSHIPDALAISSLTGIGLNEEELMKNPQLTEHVVHDLNADTTLPFEDSAFDAVICSASVEYLVQPFDVFKDVARVLKPGGLFVNTFSNRWFPPKAIKLWSELTEFERMGLVSEYFAQSGQFDRLETYSTRGWNRPETDRYYGQIWTADPVYAVWGYKKND